MERFINILIIDGDLKNQQDLKEMLTGGGNNVLFTSTTEDASEIIKSKEIGILLINIDNPSEGAIEWLENIKKDNKLISVYKIIITRDISASSQLIRGLYQGAVDFITLPFDANLVRAKIEVFKTLYYKDQRINQLLKNIFPPNVLNDLNNYNKFSPKRIDTGVVLFTDFVDFSNKSKQLNPLRLLKKLEYYFTQFDEIIKRYQLEKIKTIGDAYMALAGVTETTQEPVIRACLAALEIRDFMRNEHDVARALNKDAWEIRIGIHMGPLVAGIIGTNKISFDVWGDTVNIAARAESSSLPGCITITREVANAVSDVFNLEDRGMINILKRGGKIHMYFLKDIKLEHCLYGEGKIASTGLRVRCGLSTIDFTHMRKFIINKLKALLPEDILYHDVAHTLNVEKAAVRYALLEGLDEQQILLLQTAVLYHDAGFIVQFEKNEEFAIQLAKSSLPTFGYSEEHIHTICSIIQATSNETKPMNLLEEIMCDADHDYLGRADYFAIVKKLRSELENYGVTMSEKSWIEYQINYLENIHSYYTSTAQNIRLQAKKARIAELKSALQNL